MRANIDDPAQYVYLNSGQSGVCSEAVIQEIADAFHLERKYGTSSPVVQSNKERKYAEARESLAAMLHADPDEIALTQNTTEGINIVLYGLDLQAGDEIITTNNEHYSILVPLLNLQSELGISVKRLDLDKFAQGTGEEGEVALLAELNRLVTGRTKLIMLSHVLYTTGARMPVEAITGSMHERSVAVLIDGAQAVGHIPVDVRELGCDFYAFTGGKWLNGPAGTGGLFMLKEWTTVLKHTYSGYMSVYAPDTLRFKQNAASYEVSTKSIPLLCGLIAAVHNYIGRQYESSQNVVIMADKIRSLLAGCSGVTVLSAMNRNGIIAFSHQQLTAQEIYDTLSANRIIARTIEPLGAVRLSIPYYLNDKHMEKISQVLTTILSLKGRV